MYVSNILTNLILVNKFLETDEYSIYGLGVLRDLLFGRSWMESGNFPRVTLVRPVTYFTPIIYYLSDLIQMA